MIITIQVDTGKSVTIDRTYRDSRLEMRGFVHDHFLRYICVTYLLGTMYHPANTSVLPIGQYTEDAYCMRCVYDCAAKYTEGCLRVYEKDSFIHWMLSEVELNGSGVAWRARSTVILPLWSPRRTDLEVCRTLIVR